MTMTAPALNGRINGRAWYDHARPSHAKFAIIFINDGTDNLSPGYYMVEVRRRVIPGYIVPRMVPLLRCENLQEAQAALEKLKKEVMV